MPLLPDPIVNADPSVQRGFDAIERLFPLASNLVAYPTVTSLPSPATDGQVVYYLADDTNGVVWTLKYRSASASSYKWEFVGGVPLTNEVATDGTRAAATYGDLTAGTSTATPTITLPLAGDYELCGGARSWDAATAATQQACAIKLGSAATSDNDAVLIRDEASSASAQGSSGAAVYRRNAFAASDVVKLQYRQSAGTGVWTNKWLAVRPIRVI